MTEIEVYFPLSVFKRFAEVHKIYLEDEKELLQALSKFNARRIAEEYDVPLHVRVEFADYLRWKRLKKALVGKYLGKDVILMFKGGEIGFDDDEELNSLVLHLAGVSKSALRLSDHVVISRLLSTDIILRLFYDKIYPAVAEGELFKYIRRLEERLIAMTPDEEQRLAFTLSDLVATRGSGGRKEMVVFAPDMVVGMLDSLFPFLPKNTVWNLGLKHYFAEGYGERLGIKLPDGTREALASVVNNAVTDYINRLKGVLDVLMGDLLIEDLRQEILEILERPMTFTELFTVVAKRGIPMDKVVRVLLSLITLQEVLVENEVIKRRDKA